MVVKSTLDLILYSSIRIPTQFYASHGQLGPCCRGRRSGYSPLLVTLRSRRFQQWQCKLTSANPHHRRQVFICIVAFMPNDEALRNPLPFSHVRKCPKSKWNRAHFMWYIWRAIHVTFPVCSYRPYAIIQWDWRNQLSLANRRTEEIISMANLENLLKLDLKLL